MEALKKEIADEWLTDLEAKIETRIENVVNEFKKGVAENRGMIDALRKFEAESYKWRNDHVEKVAQENKLLLDKLKDKHS